LAVCSRASDIELRSLAIVQALRSVFNLGYGGIVLLFAACGFALLFFGAVELWNAVNPSQSIAIRDRLNAILESVGLITIAVVAFELGQTVLEEEIQRQSQISAPTRVRRFLSRFMVVVVVALSIESLVAVFELVHTDPSQLPKAASVAAAAAMLLAAWGLFTKLNTSAEELEPEAMQKAKQEDHKVE
jgi:hypothetical protein